jgi:hypothetical protein
MNPRGRAVFIAVVIPLVLVAGAVVAVQRGGGTSTPAKIPVATPGAEGKAAALADAAVPGVAQLAAVHYTAGPDLPALDGSARAYKVTGTVDQAAVDKVAAAFGLDGATASPETDGSFEITAGEAYLYVSPAAGGTVSYGRQDLVPTSTDPVCTGSTPEMTAPTCPGPTAPAPDPNLPSEDAAIAAARQVLGAAGYDLTGAELHASDGTTSWTIEATKVIDGAAVQGPQASLSIGASGVEQASFGIGHTEAADSYPLIGTAAAIDHLNDGTAYFGGFSTMGPRLAAASGTTSAGAGTAAAPRYHEPVPQQGTCTTFVNPDGTGGGSCSASGTATAGPGADGAGVACPAIAAVPPATVAPCPVLPPATLVSPPCPPAADGTTSAAPQDPGTCVQPPTDCAVPTTGAGTSTDPGSDAGPPTEPGCPGPPECAALATAPSTDPSDQTATTIPPAGDLPVPAPTLPCATDTPATPQEVVLTGATNSLMLIPSGAADAYLVPAYAFTTADGTGPTTLAIDTSWLEPVAIPDVGSDGGASDSLPDGWSEVPCSTPGFTGPCTQGPTGSGESGESGSSTIPDATATTSP